MNLQNWRGTKLEIAN